MLDGAGDGAALAMLIEEGAWVPSADIPAFLGSAVVRIVGTEIDVILNTNRTQTFEPDIFSNLGIDYGNKQLLLRGDVPQLERVVVAGRGQGPAGR